MIMNNKIDKTVERYSKYVITSCLKRIVPITVVSGDGVYIIDAEGKRYLDFATGFGVMALGHCHPEVKEAIIGQLNRIWHHSSYMLYSPVMAELAEKLAEILPPPLKKTFFCNSGAEAVEGAVKLARKYTNKYELIALYRAFHGRTMGSLSLTGQMKYKKGMGPYIPNVIHIPPPYCYRCSLKLSYPDCDVACAELLEEAIKYGSSGDVCALIIEPVMGEGGVIVPPNEYFPRIRKICSEYDMLLVVDEIQTGLGRTGKMFAIEHWGIRPDILTIAKIIGGGLPLGAFSSPEEIANAFEPGDHYTTFGGNPVACAAGLKTIEIIQRDKLADNAAKIGEYMIKRLQELQSKYSIIGDVRGKGLMIGMELVKDQHSKIPAVNEAAALQDKLREKGIIVTLSGNSTIRMLPPLTIMENHVDIAVEALNEVLRTLKN
jgi:predicted acetylornithine/succinylornithine family transaminase